MHLERIIFILEAVGQMGEASVADICANSNLPKPSAYRLVQELVGAGLLEPVARGKFMIGSRLKRITQSDLSNQALLETIAPVLKNAAGMHGVSFFLSRLRGQSVEIIHVETPDTGVSFLHPGLGKRPLHACSCSKAVAAFLPELQLDLALQGSLKAYTGSTLTKPEDIKTEFETIRAQGYAECIEEIEQGMCSLAAPLGQNAPGNTMSIGATGSMRVFTPEFRKKFGAEVIRLAAGISADLGWSNSNVILENKCL